MDMYATFTDKIVDEILYKNLNIEEQKELIYTKYKDKGFTLIGVKKERRVVKDRIQSNTVNRFDDIVAITLIILSGFISFLFINSLFERGILFKILIPLITSSVLFYLFSTTLTDMKNRYDIYKLCLYRLTDILEDIEEEYLSVEIKKVIENDLEMGSILNIGKEDYKLDEAEVDNYADSVLIDSFEFDLDDLNEEAAVEFA